MLNRPTKPNKRIISLPYNDIYAFFGEKTQPVVDIVTVL